MKAQKLDRSRAALLVVDIQEKLAPAMAADQLERAKKRTLAAITGAKALGLPIVVTEQYPKGLGRTLPEIQAAAAVTPVEKVNFSCCVPEVEAQLGNRDQILIVGMESHVCVFQTARDLAERGKTPVLLMDAVLSRTDAERQLGLQLSKDAGAIISSVEAALFDLLGRAGTPEFKAVSAAVK
ncbi:MAG: isochorismatase family protein [Myxococcaceae bacterium]